MLKDRLFLVLLIFFFWASPVGAQVPPDSEQPFSPSIGKKFYDIAYELAHSKNISDKESEQAIVFLNATMNLDSKADYIHPLLIELATKHPDRNYHELVNNSLAHYLDKSTDFEPTRKAVQYLLQRLNSREQREQLLEGLLKDLGGRNDYFDSELVTLLGLLAIEKADNETAQNYLIRAINKNRYNKLAFESLVDTAPERVTPPVYLEHLRLALGENPLDLEDALAFAQYAEEVQIYQTAADIYEYCVELFDYLYPSQKLPSSIYIPWMASNYNTQRNQHKCLQIASRIRQSGRFDLPAEAIAAKAAEKIGDKEQAKRILGTIEEKINSQSSVSAPGETEGIDNISIAWFYCFISPEENKALSWANKAYSDERESAMANAIFAYALVMNKQMEKAKQLIDNYENNQISDLALAQIQLSEGQKDLAIETLNSAIDKDPGSLEAERAKEILEQNGGEYSPPIDPDVILAALIRGYGQDLVPEFVKPDKIISAQLSTRGVEFSYGSEFGGTVTIANNSSEPLVVSDDGLFSGNIRVDAALTGDLNKKLPNLVSMKIRPSLPVKPGQSIFIPLHLLTGELRQTLLAHPQASVDIEFTLYLDPVTDDRGHVTNRIGDLQPAKLTVKRPGIELTSKYLQNRLSSLKEGQQSQKIKTAHIFTGLLMEQHAMANSEPTYKFMYADRMPASLKSALFQNLTDNDWIVKTHTMADMISLPLDYKLIQALSENLNDSHWPVRLMALYLLAKKQNNNFTQVLEWAAENDSNELVRDMAMVLGEAAPKAKIQETVSQLEQDFPRELLPTISY